VSYLRTQEICARGDRFLVKIYAGYLLLKSFVKGELGVEPIVLAILLAIAGAAILFLLIKEYGFFSMTFVYGAALTLIVALFLIKLEIGSDNNSTVQRNRIVGPVVPGNSAQSSSQNEPNKLLDDMENGGSDASPPMAIKNEERRSLKEYLNTFESNKDAGVSQSK
jgi:hypothetical protein